MGEGEDEKLTFAKGEGEIPALTERVHLDLPKAKSHWSPAASAAGDGTETAED